MANQGSRLGGSLIVRKGEAAPVSSSTGAPPSTPAKAVPAAADVAAAPVPKGLSGTVAVTVRLDQERYERLKAHGAKKRRTNQEILVAALDAYLASENA